MKRRIRLFDIYIFLITLAKSLGATADDNIYVLVFLVGCTAVFMKMYTEHFKPKELIPLLIIVGIGVLNYIVGKDTTVLFTAIAFCGLKNVKADHIIKITFWTRLFAFFAMILMSLLGIIENEAIVFYRDGAFINRYSFGYDHPNTTHMMFAIIVMVSVYLYGREMNLLHYSMVLVSNQILYSFTGSRTGLIMVWIIIVLYMVMQSTKTRKLFVQISRYLYILLFLLTLLLGLTYGRIEFLDTINQWLSGRIFYINRIVTQVRPPLIGNISYQSINIDNGYVALLYSGGILAFIWFSYYILKLTKKLYREERHNEAFLISCFIIYNMTESFFPSISVNIALVFIGEVLFGAGTGLKNERTHNIYTDLQQKRETDSII